MTDDAANPYETSLEDVVSIPAETKPGSKLGWGCLTMIVLVIGFLLVLPTGRRAPEAARRTQCKNNLKQIVLALHNYHDEHGSFPPAYTTDEDGTPLHSWRTLILPYLDQQALFNQIDLSVPWNHPKNAAAFGTTVPTYQCPSTRLDAAMTTYRAIVGEKMGLHPTRGRRFREFLDGSSNCVLVIETGFADAVHWMEPGDDGNDLFVTTTEGSETSHTSGFQAGMSDGSVRFFSSSMSTEAREDMMTINGGEDLESLQ